jgi:hypothetical protein
MHPTTESLPDWPRKYFTEPGGRPFLFYVVYGEFGNLPSLSASRYRSDGRPDGFELSHYDLDSHPDVLSRFQDGYVWNEFRGTNAALASQIAASRECLILRGEINDRADLNYLRDCVGLLTFIIDNGGIAVHDLWMFQWWSPEDWRNRMFKPAGPVPRHHVVILTSDEPQPGLTWFHTRGMRKFGRPELSVHKVPAEYHVAVIELCERLIELQAFGGKIVEGQEIRMKGLPEGMKCRHGGDLDDPDFNNVHVEILLDSRRILAD